MFLERLLFCVFCLGIEVVVQGLAEEAALREVAVDKGTNVTIPCGGLLTLPTPNVQWVYKGNRTHHEVLLDGSLVLLNVRVDYAGVYECSVENETAFVDRINVTVRTEPPPLVNVSVHASTILALILWSVAGDGGHPIIDFTAQYRSAAPVNGSLEPWRPISPNHISPNSRQIDVYHLDTNASYWFRVWANNALGAGPPVEVLATTLFTDQEAELYKHFFTGTEGFDTRTWLAAVCVVMGTLTVLAAGTCAVLCREWRRDEYSDDQDVMELVPNIILNPGFMETEPAPREHAGSIIKSTECPGPGKPRKV
ncbi:protein turtle homolog A [Choristoneura fumiferana]|uniref:protein turtle homolog A n=1 Tax=Choristoneura fumiferana TaxID=7141 RepID=UPI003D1566F4